MAFGKTLLVSGLFYGIKPAVTAIVLQAAHRIGSRALRNSTLWIVAGLAFAAMFFLNVPFPAIVLAAATIGYAGGRMAPNLFQVGGGGHAKKGSEPGGPALIDDDTPVPAHAKPSWTRLARTVLVGVVLWALPMAGLTAAFGWQETPSQMAWFFTKAALLTFGGAYAVLPYVYQGAVGHYGWLSSTQMIDGLALGETTPGPLIMVVAYVGFVGGYLKAFLGADVPAVAGILAAALVTWFTFLPSFIFILAGGPMVESTRDDLKFTAPLTAITAAVVGVILNLALFFGFHVMWPDGFGGTIDYRAAAIAAAAAVALFRFKRGVMEVIGACAVAGLILKTLAL